MTGKAKASIVSVRFDEATRKQLEKEAQAIGLDLGTYIRHLVFTHEGRKKK